MSEETKPKKTLVTEFNAALLFVATCLPAIIAFLNDDMIRDLVRGLAGPYGLVILQAVIAVIALVNIILRKGGAAAVLKAVRDAIAAFRDIRVAGKKA